MRYDESRSGFRSSDKGESQHFARTNLDGIELLVDDLHHPLDLLGRDGPRPRLLPQQVHDVRGELGAGLVVLFQLLVVDGPDLRQLVAVVWGAIQSWGHRQGGHLTNRW